MSVHALPLLLLLTMTLALRSPACAQGACGDGTCDPSETMQSCPQDCGIVLVEENGDYLWAGTNDGVQGMRTHGTGFEDGYYQLAQDPLNPRHLFYGTYGGQVYETRDGGQIWTAFDEGLMREGSIYAFEVDADGTRLYVSQKAGGVSRRALDPAAPQIRVVSGDSAPCTDGSHVYTT